MSKLTDAVDLAFLQFNLGFAPLIVMADPAGATPGAILPADWFFTGPVFVDNTGGHILGVSVFGSAFSGSGMIADIEFTALGGEGGGGDKVKAGKARNAKHKRVKLSVNAKSRKAASPVFRKNDVHASRMAATARFQPIAMSQSGP